MWVERYSSFNLWLKSLAQRFDTLHDFQRSLSLAVSLLKGQNAPIWRSGNRRLKFNSECSTWLCKFLGVLGVPFPASGLIHGLGGVLGRVGQVKFSEWVDSANYAITRRILTWTQKVRDTWKPRIQDGEQSTDKSRQYLSARTQHRWGVLYHCQTFEPQERIWYILF